MFLEQRFPSKSYGDRESTEGSHNGIAAVLKTADRKVMRVRLPRPPLTPFSHLRWHTNCCHITKRKEAKAMIRKVKEGYRVVSEKEGRNMGTYKTKDEAKERLRQVEYFKHKNAKSKGKK